MSESYRVELTVPGGSNPERTVQHVYGRELSMVKALELQARLQAQHPSQLVCVFAERKAGVR